MTAPRIQHASRAKSGPTQWVTNFGLLAILGILIVLLLMAATVARHPASIEGSGLSLLRKDVAFLFAYGAAAAWAWRQRRRGVSVALTVGSQFGLLLGAIFITNHLRETFVDITDATAQYALAAGPILLMLALFGAAGSAAWGRTRSFSLTSVAGVWCAIVAMLIGLALALSSNLVFEGRSELRLNGAFAVSGMSDPGAFLASNSLKAASEGLVRMPVLAFFLSFAGGLANSWISRRSRITRTALAWLMPVVFVIGAFALWYANSLDRSVRPPFIMTGVLLAGLALSSAHAIWSSLRRPPSLS
jgi:hypothetical protein